MAWTYDQVTRTQVAGFLLAASPHRGRWTRRCCGDWDGRQAPAWRSRSPATGPQEPNICRPGLATSARYFRPRAQSYSSDLAMQSIRLGLNYRIGDDNAHISDFLTKGPSALETDNFAFHGQATYLNQYDAPFRAPYSGPNSLAPNIGRETADVTLYAGVRLWQGAEAWVNPEIDQGFGLSGTLGVAGFPSGEAYKVGADYPYTRLHRAFLRQTIDLGGDTQKVDARHQPVFRHADVGSVGVHRRKVQRGRHLRYQQIRP